MKKKSAVLTVLFSLVFSLPALAYTNFGPTRSGNTLWGIANKHKPAGVNVMTMIEAIQKLNPEAFKGANHNILKVGETLTLPTTTDEVQTALAGTANAVANETVATTIQADEVQAGGESHWRQIALNAQQAQNRLQQQLMLAQQQLTKTNNQLMFIQKQRSAGAPNPQTKNSSAWAWAWFLVWLVTLIVIALRRKYTFADVRAFFVRSQAQLAVAPNEVHIETPAPESTHPEKGHQKADAGEQAELDIAVAGAETAKDNSEADIKVFDKAELSAQEKKKQHYLDAIAKDKTNFTRHQDLLNFYIDADDQDAFDAHLKKMVKDKVVKEGDSHWNKLRTLYLNQWVYDR